MKNEKLIAGCFSVAAVCFYVAALIVLLAQSVRNSQGLIYLGMGTVMLVLAMVWRSRSGKQ